MGAGIFARARILGDALGSYPGTFSVGPPRRSFSGSLSKATYIVNLIRIHRDSASRLDLAVFYCDLRFQKF